MLGCSAYPVVYSLLQGSSVPRADFRYRTRKGYKVKLPLLRIAGGSQDADFQGQVQAAIAAGNNTPAAPVAPNVPATETKEEGLSGFAKDFLSTVPEGERPILQKHLTEWDRNVQKKFQETKDLQSQVEPWQEFTTNGYTPEYLKQAAQLARMIEDDPQKVYEALVEQYGYGADQGVADQEEEISSDSNGEMPGWAKQQQEVLETLANIILGQQEEKKASQAEVQLDQYMSWLHETHGEFDDEYVLAGIGQGMDGVEAVQRYNSIIEKAVSSRPGSSAPPIMNSGGGLPSQAVDPASLSSKEVKDLMTNLLTQANAQG